ncbi:MAG: radical SAM protein [Phycisphaerae bacterium]|nr:radical SAM protein [Phycisphaerae bacterium]
MSHVFGPVPSRRLGRSLGIDLVPFKTCSYDCIYCQLGRTTNKTIERKEYVPLDEVLEELECRLAAGPEADYVTLSGSGEPTLYSRLAPLIAGIKERTDRPVAVLTNGSLLWDRDVQEALLEADLVIPSLDAGDEATFQWVNRPHAAILFDRMVTGIEEFRQRFSKPLWLEVFLLKGLNAAGIQQERIARWLDRIMPDRVQLNTVTRPPCEAFARPVPLDELTQAARLFGDRAEVIAEYQTVHHGEYYQARREDILNLLMRRPCTLNDLATGLGLHSNEVVKYLDELLREHVLVCEGSGAGAFYRFAKRTDDDSAPQ